MDQKHKIQTPYVTMPGQLAMFVQITPTYKKDDLKACLAYIILALAQNNA